MFSSEKEFVEELRAAIQRMNLPSNGSLLLLEEVSLGYGIADLVLTKVIDEKVKRNNFLSTIHLTILELIYKNDTINRKELKRKTRANDTSLRKAISLLQDEGFLTEEGDTLFLKDNYSTAIDNTVAIEAKLKNWKRALKQAYRYKSFSNKTYVCLPEQYANAAKANIAMFQEMEVGLLTLSPEGQLEAIYDPPKAAPINQKMNMLLNEQVLTMLHAS